MFDSVHRELSGNEPNTSMTDVDHDLQLMIDKQYKFLQVLGSIGAIVLLLCRYWGSIAIGIGSTATANSTIAIGI